MKTSIWKRMAAVGLAAAMAVSLAACGKGGDGSESVSGEASGKTTFEEPGEVNFYFMNEGQNYQKVFDKFHEMTKDTLNTTVKLNWTTDHAQEMPLKIAAQEDVDLVFDAYWINMAKNINDGIYADLSSYLNNDDYPGLKKVFTDDIIDSVREDDGSVYALPLVGSYSSGNCMFIRGDWREKYNLPEVVDEETFMQYLDTIEEHKDELGVEAPYYGDIRGFFYMGYDMSDKMNHNIFEIEGTGARASQMFEAVLNEDATKVISVNAIGDPDEVYAENPEPYNTNYRNELVEKLATDWGKYVEKDPINIQDGQKKFNAGLFAAGMGTLGGYAQTNQDLKDAHPGEDVWYECYFYDEVFRDMGETCKPVNLASNFMCVPAYSTDIDRTMAVINWIYESQENYDLFNLGIEGEDWKDTGDGTFEPLYPDDKYNFPFYQLAMCTNYSRVDSTLDENLQAYSAYASDSEKFKQNPLTGFTFDSTKTPELKTAYAAYTTLQQDYYPYFMLGAYGDEVDEKLQEFEKKAKEHKDIIREELTKQIQEFLDKK